VNSQKTDEGVPKLSANANLNMENRKRRGMVESDEDQELERLITGKEINKPAASNVKAKNTQKFSRKNNIIKDDDEDDIFSTNLEDAQFKF
jgi:hypothetical protein